MCRCGEKWLIVGDALNGFYGQYQTTMDSKGRIALPAKLRSVKGTAKKPILLGNLIITQGMEGHYPEG